jgi:hypothetical protein
MVQGSMPNGVGSGVGEGVGVGVGEGVGVHVGVGITVGEGVIGIAVILIVIVAAGRSEFNVGTGVSATVKDSPFDTFLQLMSNMIKKNSNGAFFNGVRLSFPTYRFRVVLYMLPLCSSRTELC